MFDSGKINNKNMTTSRFISEMRLLESSRFVRPQIETISRDLLNELKI
jgi:hypothetical protein